MQKTQTIVERLKAWKFTLYFKQTLCAWCLILLAFTLHGAEPTAPIDRHALVTRHNVTLTAPDAKTPLQVGNGEFAFAMDITGLQTFLPANTMSHWGWHSFPMPAGKRREDFKLDEYDTYGRTVGYAISSHGQEELYKWLRENPHRLNLGKLSFRFTKIDGTSVALGDLKECKQTLYLWHGIVTSTYHIDGKPVTVETCCDPDNDAVAVRVESPLIASGQLAVVLAFPYGSPQGTGADWTEPEAHKTIVTRPNPSRADFARELDADTYSVSLQWAAKATLAEEKPHTFILRPAKEEKALEFTCGFYPGTNAGFVAQSSIRKPKFEIPNLTFIQVRNRCNVSWPKFWNSGGAIDLSGSKDPRWEELERRIILSEYLLAIQEAGSLPPQEGGLVDNGTHSWNGKFHLEMHWWHEVQFALWDRWPLFDRSLGWYHEILPEARRLALSQGYRGARWPKMVGPDGHDSPSGVGPLLIWQQPHPIYYANLDYRLHPDQKTLEKWRDIVFDIADFLASYAVSNESTGGKYFLGPPLKTVPENTDPQTSRNPSFELSYWRFGLRVAQEWREHLGLPREPHWDAVLKNLAPLPTADGVYLQQENMTDTYTQWNWEHPSLIGALGMLPGDGVDPATMHATILKVMQKWDFKRKSWGWDFPMLAMAAARNGEPNLAIDALLMPVPANQFEKNGFSSGGPYPYFPANGGLLSAAAMMAAGWDNSPNHNAPGFPTNGQWTVRWEGLKTAP